MTDDELKQHFATVTRLVENIKAEMRTFRDENVVFFATLQTREEAEAMETRLLSAFHSWAQTYEVRARGTTSAVALFEERLGLIEERMNQLERDFRERGGVH